MLIAGGGRAWGGEFTGKKFSGLPWFFWDSWRYSSHFLDKLAVQGVKTNLKRGIHKPEVFFFVAFILAAAAIASIPGEGPFDQFINTALGMFFSLLLFLVSAIALLATGVVGILALGLAGWIVLLLLALFLFRMQFSLNFLAVAFLLFALMLVVV